MTVRVLAASANPLGTTLLRGSKKRPPEAA
jgi:hypothetical protein